MSEIWILFLVIGVLTIQLVRAYRNQRVMQKTIDVLSICIQEQTEATKNMNDMILEKLPHLREEVDAEMERWRADRKKALPGL